SSAGHRPGSPAGGIRRPPTGVHQDPPRERFGRASRVPSFAARHNPGSGGGRAAMSAPAAVPARPRTSPRWRSAKGMATTGRVVTAAAAIMVVVFASFLLDPSRMLQQFGLGLAVAVLLDALVIRSRPAPHRNERR